MGKLKNMMMENEYASQMMQQTLWTEEDVNGLLSMDYQQLTQLRQDLSGLLNGNNSLCPSMEKTTNLSVSKPKTLILNEQAKPSITMLGRRPNHGQYTVHTDPF